MLQIHFAMTKKELYRYMMAYRRKHDFAETGQSNFITLMQKLKQQDTYERMKQHSSNTGYSQLL